MSTIKLGTKAKCKITGFQGIIIAHASWLTGCDTYCIKAPCKEGEEPKAGVWIDEGAIEITGSGLNKEDVQSDKTGGPRSDHPKA